MNLNRKDIRIQSEQFLAYFYKFEDRRLNEAFKFWSKVKGFDKKTESAIRYTVYGMVRRRIK